MAAAFVRFCRGQGLIRGEWLAIDAAAVREALEVLRQQQAQAALQRMQARVTPAVMRLRRCVVEHTLAALKYRIFEKPRFVLRGRWGAVTEMSPATLIWNLKREMAVLGASQLRERLACD